MSFFGFGKKKEKIEEIGTKGKEYVRKPTEYTVRGLQTITRALQVFTKRTIDACSAIEDIAVDVYDLAVADEEITPKEYKEYQTLASELRKAASMCREERRKKVEERVNKALEVAKSKLKP